MQPEKRDPERSVEMEQLLGIVRCKQHLP
jgi:hypothetical protein